MVRTVTLGFSFWRRSEFWCGIYFLLYAIVAVTFYFWYVEPYLQMGDLMAPRLLADSITYQDICGEGVSFDEWGWLRDAGPCVSLDMLGHSEGLITLANALLMTFPAYLMARSYGVKSSSVLFLLLINPMTFLSLFGPNKEVFGIVCTISLLIYLRKRTKFSLVSTLTFALLSRLPMLAVILSFILLVNLFEPVRFGKRPWQAFRNASLILLLAISAIALIFGEQMQIYMLGNVSGAVDNSFSTSISLDMESYANNGLFAVTYIIRTALTLFGAIPNLISASFATHGVYYMVGVIGSSMLFLVMGLVLVSRKRYQLLCMNPEALHIWIFVIFCSMIFSLSPVIQHRYLYPLYPILILACVSRQPISKVQSNCKTAVANNGSLIST